MLAFDGKKCSCRLWRSSCESLGPAAAPCVCGDGDAQLECRSEGYTGQLQLAPYQHWALGIRQQDPEHLHMGSREPVTACCQLCLIHSGARRPRLSRPNLQKNLIRHDWIYFVRWICQLIKSYRFLLNCFFPALGVDSSARPGACYLRPLSLVNIKICDRTITMPEKHGDALPHLFTWICIARAIHFQTQSWRPVCIRHLLAFCPLTVWKNTVIYKAGTLGGFVHSELMLTQLPLGWFESRDSAQFRHSLTNTAPCRYTHLHTDLYWQ